MKPAPPSTPVANPPTATWRESGPKRERALCAHTEWGSWSGELYVCDRPARGHKHVGYDPRQMRRATVDEHRRIAAANRPGVSLSAPSAQKGTSDLATSTPDRAVDVAGTTIHEHPPEAG